MDRPEDSPAPVVVVGTTASGKSALAMALARARPGTEIVSVDSMCVYRSMDIGTAKPTPGERAEVPHHLLDLVEPHQEFTVAEFQGAATDALADIEGRGVRALLVGGAGLYQRALVDAFAIPGRWPALWQRLDADADGPGGLPALFEQLRHLDPLAASRVEPGNRRRILRALEVTLGSGRPFSSFGPGLDAYPATRFRLVGIPFDPSAVDAAIEVRLRDQLEAGFLDEVRRLAASPWALSRTARQALGYRELLRHVEDGAPFEECVAETLRRTRAFARRQWAWFRRDPRIAWLEPAGRAGPAGAAGLLDQLLALWDGAAPSRAGDGAARD